MWAVPKGSADDRIRRSGAGPGRHQHPGDPASDHQTPGRRGSAGTRTLSRCGGPNGSQRRHAEDCDCFDHERPRHARVLGQEPCEPSPWHDSAAGRSGAAVGMTSREPCGTPEDPLEQFVRPGEHVGDVGRAGPGSLRWRPTSAATTARTGHSGSAYSPSPVRASPTSSRSDSPTSSRGWPPRDATAVPGSQLLAHGF
jgi:hypothetical protein